MSHKIDTIEGIGPAYAEKLRGVEIRSTEKLLERGATRAGRKDLAEKTGISDKLVLKFCNHADLIRVSGIGGEFAELLEAAGVDTVKELRNRNAANLAAKMAEVNAAKKLTRRVPSEKVVSGWVEKAQSLSPAITY
jgi:predicted flap endonuclease-1-like 5' DNA nuclease